MLVLSRRKDQKIIINDNITITIVEIRGGKVFVGIDAPKEVQVHREEIYDAIIREKSKSKVSTPDDGGRLHAEGSTGSSNLSDDPIGGGQTSSS